MTAKTLQNDGPSSTTAKQAKVWIGGVGKKVISGMIEKSTT